MLALTQAIYGKLSGSTLETAINGRLFEDIAEDGVQYPYVVYSVVRSPKEKTFTEVFRNTLVEFVIFSNNSDATEIKTIYSYLSALYDECRLTLSPSVFYRMHETNMTMNAEKIEASSGSDIIRTCFVEFEILTEI